MSRRRAGLRGTLFFVLTDPHSLLVATLARLQQALGGRDVDGAVDCFVPDGALYGAAVVEQAHGSRELRSWLQGLVARDLDPRWTVDETYVRMAGDEIWFVADAVLDVLDGTVRTAQRFRMSGSLRGTHGFYRFELFNGFEPLLRPDLLLVS